MGSQDQTLAENGVSRPSPSLSMRSSIPLAEMSNSKTEGGKPSDLEAQQDAGSILSGISKDTFEEERGVTCTDIKLIMPTVLILLFTLFIMVTVIPYAFSSVIKQLQAVWALEEQIAAEATSKVSGPDLAENNADNSDCSCS